MTKQNDTRILQLQEAIKKKKKAMGKAERFAPVTNCSLLLDGERTNIHTLDRPKAIVLLVKLNVLKTSAEDLGFENEYELNGYKVEDWMEDIQTKLRLLSRIEEEKQLKTLESKLNKLLSDDKKVELELDSIANLLK